MNNLSTMKPRGHHMTWLKVAAMVLAAGLATPSLSASPAYLRIADSPSGTAQSVELEANKSMLVDLPTNAGEVIASQPAVATVVMRSKTRAFIQGVSPGVTNIFFLDPAGDNIAVLDITVVQQAPGGNA